MIHPVTWGKEKPSCSRESDSTVAPAGVIIREQRSILLMACPSTMSTNMPRAASGTRVSASSTLSAAEARRQHRHQQPPQRQQQQLQQRRQLLRQLLRRLHQGLLQHQGLARRHRRAREPQSGGTEIGGRGPQHLRLLSMRSRHSNVLTKRPCRSDVSATGILVLSK